VNLPDALSYLIERAVRWGGMSFEELLRDVVKSNDALAQVWETLGIRPPSSDTGA
jgi:predicted component of type VI protein secretion system